MSDEPTIPEEGTPIELLGVGSKPPQPPGSNVEVKPGLGVFGDSPDFTEAAAKASDKVNESMAQAMREKALVNIAGMLCKPVSMESLAMLQQIGSPFVSFLPKLTKSERAELQRLAKKMAASEEGDGEELTKAERKELDGLVNKVKEENAQFGNVTMSVLNFLAIHSPDVSDDDREEMIFDDPKLLRKHSLRLGRVMELVDMEQIGREIGQAVEDAKSTKVVPVSKDGPAPGND